MPMFDTIKYREIQEILEKNTKNCQIIAISKNHPQESVLKALDSGVRIFGENRVIEAKNKFKDLRKTYHNIELHLTGPLQTNKAKLAIDTFDVFHTIDREKIVKEFSKYKDRIQEKKMYIQVNTGQEQTKSGIHPKQLDEFVKFCKFDNSLNVRGLMCIPPINESPKTHFNLLQSLAKKNNLTELSIGMSNDYLDALDFNPSYIRLGTILFGKRNWNK